jgi:hypothetical protein
MGSLSASPGGAAVPTLVPRNEGGPAFRGPLRNGDSFPVMRELWSSKTDQIMENLP